MVTSAWSAMTSAGWMQMATPVSPNGLAMALSVIILMVIDLNLKNGIFQ
jgi:hypothetical protein